MTPVETVVALVLLLATLKGLNEERLQRWKPTQYYKEDKIETYKDSLLDNWAKNEMRRWDILDSLEALEKDSLHAADGYYND